MGHEQGDEIHHNYGVDLLAALTYGLNREDAYKMMQEFENQGVPTGNNVNNLSAITPREHKAIHRELINKGIEFGPKKVREADPRWNEAKNFLNKIRDLPYEARKEIIPEYINTIIRGIDESAFDVMRYKDFHNEAPETVAYARSLQPKSKNMADEEVSDQANAFLSSELDKLIPLIRCDVNIKTRDKSPVKMEGPDITVNNYHLHKDNAWTDTGGVGRYGCGI